MNPLLLSIILCSVSNGALHHDTLLGVVYASSSHRIPSASQIHWVLLISRQGKVRLAKWFEPMSEGARAQVVRDVCTLVLTRGAKMCNVVDWRDCKIVYKRYASLYFVACVDHDDNELLTMESLHLYVEALDRYFGSVCELDLIFNFTRAYWILSEIFSAGELTECSKHNVLAAIARSDSEAENAPEFSQKRSSSYTPRR